VAQVGLSANALAEEIAKIASNIAAVFAFIFAATSMFVRGRGYAREWAAAIYFNVAMLAQKLALFYCVLSCLATTACHPEGAERLKDLRLARRIRMAAAVPG